MSESAESDHLELYLYAGLISVAVVAGLISLDYYSLWTCPERDIAFQYEFTLEISEAQDGGWDICLPDSSHSFSDD